MSGTSYSLCTFLALLDSVYKATVGVHKVTCYIFEISTFATIVKT